MLEYNEPTIAILGTGASAAYTYFACRELGLHPDVYGSTQHWQTGAGAFWLWDVPPALKQALQPKDILMFGEGTSESYMVKQWGRSLKTYPSSFPSSPRVVRGYEPGQVMPLLWSGVRVNLVEMMNDERVAELASTYHLVFQTFASRKDSELYKRYRHTIRIVEFNEDSGYAKNASRVEMPAPYASYDNFVLYDGLFRDLYVRKSYLFGKLFLEFPARLDGFSFYEYDPYAEVHESPDLSPDLPSEMELHPAAPNIYLMGRYAEWNRKKLAHESYRDTLYILESDWGVPLPA